MASASRETRRAGYFLDRANRAGWVNVPAQPIIQAGYELPCEVTRPDGRVVYVEFQDDAFAI